MDTNAGGGGVLLHFGPFNGPTWRGVKSGATLGLALRVSSPQASPWLVPLGTHGTGRVTVPFAALTLRRATQRSLGLCHRWGHLVGGRMEGRDAERDGLGWREGMG